MAKVIKYKFLSCWVNHGAEENPKYEPVFLDKELNCSTEADFEISLPIAQAEAYNGEYTIDGEFDPENNTASTDDVLNALLGVM